MTKLLTGALAGSAGGTLLLAAARTFTPWNSKASVSGGNIVAAGLPAATVGVGTASMTGAPAVAANSAFARNLPGNIVLDVTGIPMAGTPITGTPVTRTVITGAARIYTVTPGTAAISSSPVVVTATISLPKSPTVGSENSAKYGSVSLTNLMVTPTQD